MCECLGCNIVAGEVEGDVQQLSFRGYGQNGNFCGRVLDVLHSLQRQEVIGLGPVKGEVLEVVEARAQLAHEVCLVERGGQLAGRGVAGEERGVILKLPDLAVQQLARVVQTSQALAALAGGVRMVRVVREVVVTVSLGGDLGHGALAASRRRSHAAGVAATAGLEVIPADHVVPVLDGVVGATGKGQHVLGPLGAHLREQVSNNIVLFSRPGGLLHVGVEMVDVSLSALLTSTGIHRQSNLRPDGNGFTGIRYANV